MKDRQKTIDIILEEFLKSEVAATDERIMSIRRFMEALQKEVAEYISQPHEKQELIGRETLAGLIDDMADIYSQELSQLITKRSRIYNHLTSVHIAACNGESARSKHFYLN
ncbi:MAG: hypothetical protein IJD28_04050 [Deferribacterales bacterium]|nr:hypothetical protein [Deferribacterales bacterium]